MYKVQPVLFMCSIVVLSVEAMSMMLEACQHAEHSQKVQISGSFRCQLRFA